MILCIVASNAQSPVPGFEVPCFRVMPCFLALSCKNRIHLNKWNNEILTIALDIIRSLSLFNNCAVNDSSSGGFTG